MHNAVKLAVRVGCACVALALSPLPGRSQVVLPPDGRPVGIACAYNTTPPSIATGNVVWVQCDTTGKLLISNPGGSTGSTSNATSGQATASTNSPSVAYNYIFNGTTWDQWKGTGGSANVTPNCQYSGIYFTYGTGQVNCQTDNNGSLKVTQGGSSDLLVGIAPIVGYGVTAQVGKAAPGNLYGIYTVNLSAVAGFLVTINAVAAPTSGAAITPVECIPIAVSPSGLAQANYSPGPPDAYSTGIVALLSTSCLTYTPSTLSGFFKLRVR